MLVVRYMLDKYGTTLYATLLLTMRTSTKERSGTVKQRVTADFILDEYEKAKKKRGTEKEKAMEQLKILSQNLGAYIVKEDK